MESLKNSLILSVYIAFRIRPAYNALSCFISVLRTLFNLIVFCDAKRRLPEFSGLQGKRFPGQPDPLPYIVNPRRPFYQPSESESRRIGSRRSKSRTITITVTPADETCKYSLKTLPN